MDSALVAHVDQVIEYFNRRRMDLPDGFFDRKAQFVVNGETFESLLSHTPNDPLVMMLARGPAGYRFTAKALQHAVPDVKIDRGDIIGDGDSCTVTLRVSGTMRGTGEALDTAVDVAMRLTQSGGVALAEATIGPGDLRKIREARLRS